MALAMRYRLCGLRKGDEHPAFYKECGTLQSILQRRCTIGNVVLERVHEVERPVVVGSLKRSLHREVLGLAQVQVVAQLRRLRHAQSYTASQQLRTLAIRALDLRLEGREFDSRLSQLHRVSKKRPTFGLLQL